MATQTKEDSGLSVKDYLERALDDLNEAREEAQEEMRTMIDSAIHRSREALDHLRADAEERTESIRERTEARAAEWRETLEHAPEDARRELGVQSVRAQRSEESLKAMADEIDRQKKEIKSS